MNKFEEEYKRWEKNNCPRGTRFSMKESDGVLIRQAKPGKKQHHLLDRQDMVGRVHQVLEIPKNYSNAANQQWEASRRKRRTQDECQIKRRLFYSHWEDMEVRSRTLWWWSHSRQGFNFSSHANCEQKADTVTRRYWKPSKSMLHDIDFADADVDWASKLVHAEEVEIA